MNKTRLSWSIVWPWLLLLVPLTLGPLLGSCASGLMSSATPTATKTPRVAAVITPPPATKAPSEEPSEVPPTPSAAPAVNTQPPAATQAPTTPEPAETPAPAASPTVTQAPTAPADSNMGSPDFGAQAFLWWREEVADRDLQLMRDAGFRWVKQYFSWQDVEGAGKGQFDWTHTDRIVDQTQKSGLKLLVRLSANPDRAFWAGNPPGSTKDFADFAGAVAARYAGRIQAYQVWNEPNLAREWGNARPDPAAYAQMLKATYAAIKGADPKATVITAGMAPTTRDDDVAMPDMRFYQGLYDAMGGNSNGYYDMLGVHGTGWAVSPETDPQEVVEDAKLHNNDPSSADLLRVYAFRHVEDVRALMERNGDKDKRVAILEFGWTTDNRPNSPYYWFGAGAGISEQVQANYLVHAYQYAAAHWQPWVGLMTVIYMPDVNWTKEDEQYWWSIIGPGYPDSYWRPAYMQLCIYFNGLNGKTCKYAPPQ
jgi:polysaccharide biosynthesis protein PslG